jgi:hypothetical protein
MQPPAQQTSLEPHLTWVDSTRPQAVLAWWAALVSSVRDRLVDAIKGQGGPR